MSYPRWFPYPGSWLKSLVLCVSLIPVRIFFLVTEPSVSYVLGIDYFVTYDWSNNHSWRFWTWFVVIGIFVPIVVLSHVYQLLWGNSSTRLKMWLEGFLSWLICIISVIVCVLVLFIRYDGFPSDLTFFSKDETAITIVFFISAAYLFQIRALVKELWVAIDALIKRSWAAIKHWLDTV